MSTRIIFGRILFFCCLFYAGLYGYAQKPALKNYTVTQGLPGNVVYDIQQDSKGYLWLATENGVSRFDGNRFRNYTLQQGLADNEIFKVREDYKGRIWFLSYNGRLSYYFNGLLYNASNSVVLDRLNFTYMVKNLFIASDSTIWISSEDEGIKVLYPDESVISYSDTNGRYNGIYEFTQQGSLIYGYASGYRLTFDGKHIVEESPVEGQYLISKTRQQTSIYRYTPGAFIKDNEYIAFDRKPAGAILCFLKDSRSTCWIGTRTGLFVKDRSLSSWIPLLDHVTITSIQEDSEGNVWIGTLGQGVYMAPALRFYEITSSDEQPFPALHSLYYHKGLLYAGTDYGSVYVISTMDFSIKKLLTIGNPGINKVRKLYVSPEGIIWSGTDRGIFAYEHGRFRQLSEPVSVKDLYLHNDSLYFATNSGILRIARNGGHESWITNGRTTSLGFMDNQMLWGTLNGLKTTHPRTDEIQQRLHNKRVTKILTDTSLLIAGTYGEGIFGQTKDTIWHLSEKQGLRGNIIQDMTGNMSEELWILSDKALNRVRLHTSKPEVIAYSSGDGLLADQLNAFCFKGDTIYMATDKGLIFFVPPIKVMPGSHPSVFITAVEVNGLPFETEKLDKLAYFQNNLRFDFSGIDLASLDDVRFQYRLDRLENDWTDADNNFVLYRGLKPGHYTFHVRLVSKHGHISGETAAMRITIQPHFTGTRWFRISLTSVLLVMPALIGYWYFNRYRRRQKTKLTLLRLEHSALRSQMNPHFLFNTLNSIQQFVLKEDKRSANRYLVRFATLIRKYLENSKDLYIQVSEELESLEMYIELENLRMGNKVLIHIDRPPAEILHRYIPSMLIQPLIENAFQHALLPIVREGGEARLSIRFDFTDSILRISVTDNGTGFVPGQNDKVKPGIPGIRQSTAIQNIHERIKVLNKLHGFKAELLFQQPVQGTGTEAIVVLPLLNELI